MLLSLPAGAAEPPLSPTLALKLPVLRQRCYQQAVPGWETGVTHDVIQADDRCRDCLLALAEQVLKQYYSAETFPGGPRKVLKCLLLPLGDLHHRLQTRVKSCAPDCGSMYQMAASGAEGHFLETLLREIADRVLMETDAALVMESPRWDQCWKRPESCPQVFPVR